MLDRYVTEMRELEDGYWWFVARHRLVLKLLDAVPVGEQRMLDAGCGSGALLAELARRGDAYGVDVSAAAVALARERGLGALVRANIQRLPWREGAFDAITLCDVLEHVADDALALREAARALRPGGVAIITLPALDLLWSSHDEALGHHRRYGSAEARRLFAQAGLTVEKLSFGLFFLFPVAVVMRSLQRLMNRLRPRPASTGIIPVPQALNALLTKLMDLENALICRLNLPIGVSLVVVARKPVEVAEEG